ncbi:MULTISPECIES: hypothetical protein [Trichocoleus]|uniref:Uncharacterized protein n=1 Tax=Trichocoleus desertorum GB2-A4 TaxID=2933944 RepID=A0ABV0JCU3_9CYAN|nr:hypothetical protein [Trichocoleus sp. FACHB-46]MBD1864260.1 hypothetical protein [Trichocoleus sp. FACHB-46]
MANPAPVQTPEFLKKQFKPQGEIPPGTVLADKPVCVKLPVEVDAAVRSLSKSSDWLRRVICEAAQKELLEQSGSESP